MKFRSLLLHGCKYCIDAMDELPLGGGNMTSIPTPLVDEDAASDPFAPLAARMRPVNFDEYIGQEHLVGPNMPLRRVVESGNCFSMILWGPPGVGKTTLAFLIAKQSTAVLEQISAINSSIEKIREAIDRATNRKKQGKRTILFVDEVHRFNKNQQDAFLPYIENGTIIFIGATTENPSFSVNQALMSRTRTYDLKPLEHTDLDKLIELAITLPRGLKKFNITFGPKAREALVDLSNGDARQLLNNLEIAALESQVQSDGSRLISYENLRSISGGRLLKLDKNGDAFYDLLSAFHKSVRGSDPDAALYWYARMVEAGGDPQVIARRILAIATEDVGLADPNAMQIALNAWDIYHRVGASEGQRAIAEAAVYMALAPKSNCLYVAFEEACADVREMPPFEVPLYIRNAPTKFMEERGYHKGYKYPHDSIHGIIFGECYFPQEMDGRRYYFPTERGYEKYLTERVSYLQSCNQRIVNEQRRFPLAHASQMMTELKKRYPQRFATKQKNPHH